MNYQSSAVITPAVCRSFVPMNKLKEARLQTLVESSEVEHVSRGTQIIKRGSVDHWTYYLLEGRLELEAVDGGKKVIEGGTSSAMNPIAQLRPRQYNVTALSDARLLKIESDKLDSVLASQTSSGINAGESGRSGQNEEQGSFEDQLYCDIYRAVVRDALMLPSLPEVAIRVRELLERENIGMKQLAKVVQTDFGISAKLVKAANSALYAGATPVDSLAKALVRLGMKATSELVLCFAANELFRTQSRILKEQMQTLWRHSTQVAAMSFVLAQKTSGFDPERALLMGLLHDIGVIAILNYLEKYSEAANNARQVEEAISRLRGEIGGMILRKWNFPEDFATTAIEVEDWNRNPGPKPDYCDLVMIAQLHSFIDTPTVLVVPPMYKLPAFNKLALGQLTPRMGLELLDQAKDQVDEVMKMLAL